MKDPSEWRLATPKGTPFTVISRQGWFEYEDAQNTETYLLRASDLMAFVREGFPPAVLYGGMFYYPLQPTMGGMPSLVPQRISYKSLDPGRPCDPFGTDSDAPDDTYSDYIEVTVEYGPRPENDREQDPNNEFTFLEISMNAGQVVHHTPLPSKGSYWGSVAAGNEVTEANIPYSVQEPTMEWSICWPRVPSAFWWATLLTKLKDRLGKVNSDSPRLFNSPPKDTILLSGFSARQQWTWREGRSGASPVRVDMKFSEVNFEAADGTKVTHQHVYRPGVGWRKLLVNNQPLFQQASMGAIWSAF